MAKPPMRDKTREKASIVAAKNRRELIAAGLNRRDLLKMGLLTSAGMLIPKIGLRARPLTSAGYVDDTPQSRFTRAFIEDMPRLVIKQPGPLTGPPPQIAPNTAAGESRTIPHQAFAQFPPQKFYEIQQKAFLAKSSPDFVQPTTLWGFDGLFPGPLFVARYGEPILVRNFNDLPAENDGFGLNSTTTHLHNGHTPSESDGFPCFFNPSGKFYDHHYPNVLLTTHEGKQVRFYDDLPRDKIVLINFMYVKCDGVCSGITANLAKLQKLLGGRLGRDIFMYSLTLKPEEDTPAALRRYAEAYKVGKGWSFLTGTPADMELLRRKLGFTDPDPLIDAVKSSHIGNVRYGNEALQRWGSSPGLSKASWIAESISWVDWPRADREIGKGVSNEK